jgi:hypothetical protein
LQEVEEQQLRWYGRVMRMEYCRIARRVAEWKPQETKRRDAPVNTCKAETSRMKTVSIERSGRKRFMSSGSGKHRKTNLIT